MKKYIGMVLSILVLTGCTGYVKSENGSDNIARLDAEPKGCKFLYTMQTEASYYEVSDAYRYLENRIASQSADKNPNAYYVTKKTTKQNEWVMFGPERSYVFEAKVYNCPNFD